MLATVGGLLAAILLPIGARANVGAGVGASPITVAAPLHPGDTIRFPPLLVANTGSEPAVYHVSVQQFGPTANTRPVPAGWVLFGANDVTIPPGKGVNITVTVRLPSEVAVGAYESLLIASTRPASATGTTALGAAAATNLTFNVTAGQAGLGLTLPPPGTLIPIGVFALLAAALLTVRRLGLALRLERRDPRGKTAR